MCREVQELWMIKKKERPITSFFGKKVYTSKRKRSPKPSDAIRNDSSDQACSTTKRCGSKTASIEPSSGNVNSFNADLSEKPQQPKLKQFPLKEVVKQERSFNPNGSMSSIFCIIGKKMIL